MGTDALTVGSVRDVAVIVMDGRKPTIILGAEYVVEIPLAVDFGARVPHPNSGQYVGDPIRLHVTPLLLGSFPTVAVSWTVERVLTDGEGGEITMVIVPAAKMVRFTEAFFLLSATAVAISVTIPGTGTLLGAVYDTEFEATMLSTPHATPVQPFPDKLHVTPLAVVSLRTLAVNICV
jgi:hypothetical protein